MEHLIKRFPLTNQLILNNIDDQTLINIVESSREIHQGLDNSRFFWIRMMSKYNRNFKEFQESWKKVVNKTPVDTIKELSLVVEKFFAARSSWIKKQWHPLSIAGTQGSLQPYKHIFDKTGYESTERKEDKA